MQRIECARGHVVPGVAGCLVLTTDDPAAPFGDICDDAHIVGVAIPRPRARMRVMVIGFSAGGHVAGSLAMRFDARVYAARNEADQFSARPDSVKLMYPVITMKEGAAQTGSRASLLGEAPVQVLVDKCSLKTAPPANTPATLIIHAADDVSVPVNNALMMVSALRAAAVPASLHIFDSGGHGFSLRGIENDPRSAWLGLVMDWGHTTGIFAAR